jgi:hypothetical protein
VLDVPNVWDSLTVGPVEAIGHWTDDLHHDEGAFPRCGELMHSLGVLAICALDLAVACNDRVFSS